MRKLLSVLTAVLVVSATFSPAFARSIFITPGARANGLGGAFVAVADDLTAIYWNPAGLAKQKRSAEIAATYISADVTSNNPFDPNRVGTTSRKFQTNALLPFLAGVVNTKNDMSVAAGVYAAGGGAGKYNDTAMPIDVSQSFMIYNVSAAKEIKKGLSVGIGVDMVNMENNLEFKIPAVGADTDIRDYGYGFQFNGGVLYDISSCLTGGLTIKSGTSIKLNCKNDMVSGNASKNFSYPFACALGAAYKPIEKLTLAASIEQTSYSATQDLNIAAISGKDMTQYHIGGEYQLCEKWAVSLGFQNDPSLWDMNGTVNNVMIINTYQYNLYSYVANVGYKTGAWKADLSVGYSSSQSLQVGGTTYQYNLVPVRCDVSYCF